MTRRQSTLAEAAIHFAKRILDEQQLTTLPDCRMPGLDVDQRSAIRHGGLRLNPWDDWRRVRECPGCQRTGFQF